MINEKKYCFISAAFLHSFFYCCHKADRCLGVIKLTDEARSTIPYKGGEHLVFTDSIGDTLNYNVEKPIYHFGNVKDQNSGNYYKCEICYEPTFHINLGVLSPFDSPLQLTFGITNFTIVSHSEITYNFTGYWICKSGKLYLSKQFWSGITYYDSLTIVNKKFYSVYELNENSGSDDGSEFYSSMYYTIQQGIVGIKTLKVNGKGRTWYLN